MKTYLTISEMMKKLRIGRLDYERFRSWCFKHRAQLDTQLCKWNHGYLLYNVQLVSELYPNTEYYRRKHAAPSTTPVEAAEMLGESISKETGVGVTGTEVLAAFEREKDYIRMRSTMARVLRRMRKERMACKRYDTSCQFYRNACKYFWTSCDNSYLACDERYRKMDKRESIATNAAFVTMILFVITAVALLTHIFMS